MVVAVIIALLILGAFLILRGRRMDRVATNPDDKTPLFVSGLGWVFVACALLAAVALLIAMWVTGAI